MNGSIKVRDLTTPSGISSMHIFTARNNPKNNIGFKDRTPIAWEDHVAYMEQHLKEYKLVEGIESVQYFETDFGKGDFKLYAPIGYFGIIKNDIRFCVFPPYRKRGAGTQILKHIKENYPMAIGRVFPSNKGSIKAFMNAQVPFTLVDDPNDRDTHQA